VLLEGVFDNREKNIKYGGAPMTAKVYPAVALRGTAVFPFSVKTLDIGRKNSLIAVEQAVSEESLIVLVGQRSSSQEYPQKEDLYSVGVMARVRQVMRIPGGYSKVLVEGLHRVYIDEINDIEPYISVQTSEMDTVKDEDSVVPMLRVVDDLFMEYISLSQNLNFQNLELDIDNEDPEQWVDIIAGNIPFNMEKKQVLLETADLAERMEMLSVYLQEEIEFQNIEKNIKKQVQSKMEKTQREYFLREQLNAIQSELGQKDGDPEVSGYRKKLENLNLSEEAYEKVEQEINRLTKIPQGSPERVVIDNYLEWIFSLPWNITDEQEVDLKAAQEILDADHYGLEKVKERIIEYIAVLKLTDSLKGPIICLVGPPGVGKTSLAQSIAKALGRKFVASSLGGVRDEAEIRGHRRTYIGSMPGRIIQALKRVKTKNPLFLFDEIDKMSSDFRGDPASAMLEVLDPEQNAKFIDHFLDIPFDLSKIVFLTTANATHTIPRPLLDRMEVINLSGYTEYEKIEIAKRHLIPKQLKAHGLRASQVKFSDEAISIMINEYTREAGVRNLERTIANLSRKVAREVVAGERKTASITENTIYNYLGKPLFTQDVMSETPQIGVATALAWTQVGGDTMPVEVVVSKGSGKLSLTGKLGDVMKESAQTAIGYLRSKIDENDIEPDFFQNNDIHIHVPQGAIPKDGPSAGITIAVAILSAIRKQPIKQYLGFTGEVTLSGKVLKIGGLKEKLLAAIRLGITEVIIPMQNSSDVEEMSKQITDKIKFNYVTHVDEVFEKAFMGEKNED
jgi:ATP-dependent Lon protease